MSGYSVLGHCVIRNSSVILNGKLLFQLPTSSLENFLLEAYHQLTPEYPKYYKMDNLCKLGFLAAEVLLKEYSVPDRASTAVVLSNAHASLDTDMRYWESTKAQASPALFVYTLPNIVIGEICIRHGIKGENAFFISEQFNPTMLTDYTAMVLLQPGTQRCLAGWVDVMGEHHDVFLYLMEKSESGNSTEVIREQLKEIYQLDYGKINSGAKKTDY